MKFSIDGETYTLSAVFSNARDKGFSGSKGAIQHRLKNGATTWPELLAPVQEDRGRAATRAAHRAEEKALMAQLCAELDARKAALQEVA